jgi:hypothetical protein
VVAAYAEYILKSPGNPLLSHGRGDFPLTPTSASVEIRFDGIPHLGGTGSSVAT